MRRSDREITDIDEMIEVIKKCDVCRLAFNDNKEGVPYILPLNFGFEIDENKNISLFFHGATSGYKYDVISRNPMASFEMDCDHNLVSDKEKGHCTMEYRSVIGRGTVSLISDNDEKMKALTILTDNYHSEHFEFNPNAVSRTTVMKLTVEKMTAKKRLKTMK